MKRFYNNTKMSGALGKALRMLALLCVLFGFSSSAWADYYFYQTDQDNWCDANGNWLETTKEGNVYTFNYTFTEVNKNYYFWIASAKSVKNIQNKDNINFKSSEANNSGVNITINKEYGCPPSGGSHINAKGFYMYSKTANAEVTIIVDLSDLKNITITIPEVCLPKSTLKSASYKKNGEYIELTGSMDETCGLDAYYGFRFKEEDETEWNNSHIPGATGNNHHSISPVNSYTVNWTGFEKGKTYVFCAYAYDKSTSTFYNSKNTLKVSIPEGDTEVLLTKNAIYDENTKKATLYGYLKQNPVQNGNRCAFIVEYGFVLEQGITAKPKVGNQNAFKVISPNGGNTENLIHGETFEATSNELADGQVYAYRAYVLYGGTYIYSNEIRYLSTGGCIPQPGGNGTIYITVDGSRSPADDDDCALIYSSLQTALDKLKENELYTADGNLLQAVVITVSQFDNAAGAVGRGTYVGNKEYYVSGGNADGVDGQSYARKLRVLAIDGFNKNKEESTYDAEHTLTIQANNGDKPRVEHILIRKSRNVILKGLNIFSNDNGTTKDTALEIDEGEYRNWDNVTKQDIVENSNIVVKDCTIGSNGFTGVHINSYSGLTFENCTFNLSVPDSDSNTKDYGSSVKFYQCKDIKFIRNNFWGAHTTLLWLQQTQNALFYNNVFWNTNENTGTSSQAVRVYDQYNDANKYLNSSNIAILYNTFYIKDDKNTSSYSFIYFDYYVGDYVYFKYNNCYSYDKDMKVQRTSPVDKYNSENRHTLCPNNYWSVVDEYNDTPAKDKPVFDPKICGSTTSINVANLVCETSASGPASLVIKQPEGEGGLKVGDPLTRQDLSSMSGGILLSDEELTYDRYNKGARDGDKWTLGALEATSENFVETIYWIGGDSDEWDNRNNWAYIIENARAADQRTLTCVDVLSPNLKVVIPQKGSPNYPTTTKATYYYPVIPASFDATARQKATEDANDMPDGIPASEQVSAGVGTGQSVTKYAETIELEYGAALKGIHNLYSLDKLRYDEAITTMTLPRDQWTLVGPVVFPWKDDTKTETRDVISGDYFLDYVPNVYMHDALIGEGPSLTWNKSFASLSVPVPANSAFAVSIPNSYGNLWGIGFPADVYYTQIAPDKAPDHPMINDATVPKSFKPFVGRFVNDKELITYSGLTPGHAVLLNNSYPCNISVEELQKFGTVYLYDYLAKSFKPASVEFDYKGYEGKIKPQNGFVFIPSTESVTVTEAMLVGGDTKSRSAEIENNKVAINLHAGSSNSLVHSSISIEHDPELGTNVESAINAPKVFAYREAPELYMMAHDKTLCRLAVPKSETVIPLGIQVKTPMYVTFKVARNSGYSKVTLVDTENNYEHDLLESPYTADILPKGTCEGRYFLNVVSDASDFGDDDVTTSVEDASGEDLAINIYNDTDNSDAITVVTSNVELEKIYVSDSMGRVIPFEAKGNYAKIQIPNAMGVYIVQVIGDKASRTEKVILK